MGKYKAWLGIQLPIGSKTKSTAIVYAANWEEAECIAKGLYDPNLLVSVRRIEQAD